MSSRPGLGLLLALLVLLVGTQGQPDRFGLGDLAQLSQLFTGPLGGESSASGYPGQRRQCVPFQHPNDFGSIQDYCRHLRTVNDSVFQQQYSSAAGPRSGDVFPLNGCVLGCVLGRESYATAMRFGSGVWSGKCFSNYDYRAQHADVINLLSPLPPGVSVVDAFDWQRFFPVVQQFKGDLSIGRSWDDIYTTRLRRSGSSWAIVYDDVVPQNVPDNLSGIQAMSNFYTSLVKQTRDEMREVAPGMLVGHMYARPQTGMNPLPIPVNQRIIFALFQVCDGRGGFAKNGNERDFSPVQSN